MKNPVLCLLILWLLVGTSPRAATALDLYVSPAGNDAWSGRQPAANAAGTDGPMATLPAALKRAREARQKAGAALEQISLFLRGGRYWIAEPIVLTAEDSGLSADRPLTIANFPEERPVISGGRRITGWKIVPGSSGVWEANARESGDGNWYFRSLFVKDRRATRARTPNAGSFFHMQGERFSDKPVLFAFKPGDLKPQWANEPDAELVAFEKWIDFRQHIRAVLTDSNVVRLSTNAASHTHEPGARYYVENTADSLDAPGEWYLDRQTGLVRYWPLPGETIARTEVIAPRLSELMRLQGDLAARKPLHHVLLRGLSFEHTDW